MAESRAKRRKLTAEQVSGSQVRYSEAESGVAGSTGAALRGRSVGCCTITLANDPAWYTAVYMLVHTNHSTFTQIETSRKIIERMALLETDSPLTNDKKELQLCMQLKHGGHRRTVS